MPRLMAPQVRRTPNNQGRLAKLTDYVRAVVSNSDQFNINLLNEISSAGNTLVASKLKNITDANGVLYAMCGFTVVGGNDKVK